MFNQSFLGKASIVPYMSKTAFFPGNLVPLIQKQANQSTHATAKKREPIRIRQRSWSIYPFVIETDVVAKHLISYFQEDGSARGRAGFRIMHEKGGSAWLVG